ncbi:MAG: hypothetical protein EOM25_15220, partial [Deltaproteobacteria bacterium]|nr:hypothetical protein [Deltaproteobacteria bacterium]
MAYTPPAGDKIRGRFASLDWVAPDGGQIRARFCGAWTRPRGDYVNAHFGFPGTFGDELVAHFGCRFICSEALDIIPLALAHAHTLSSSLLAELAQIQPQALTHGQTLSEGRLSFAILSYGLAHAQDLNAPAHEQTHILRTPGIEHFNDQFSFVEPLPAYRKPSRSRSAWAAPWDKPQAKPRPFLGPWDGQVKTDRPVRATHASPLPEDMALLSPWLALPEKDRPVRATHASPLPEDMALLSPWLDIQTKDRPVRATHASPLPEDATCLLPYTA